LGGVEKMSNKHFLPPPEEFFADDFPEEMTQEELTKMLKDLETKPLEKAPVMNNVDLHLGPAEVKPLSPWAKDPQWWVKENITKFGLEVFALDIVIVLMSCWFVWLMIDSWIYFFS
jgi:hypothetical protein